MLNFKQKKYLRVNTIKTKNVNINTRLLNNTNTVLSYICYYFCFCFTFDSEAEFNAEFGNVFLTELR